MRDKRIDNIKGVLIYLVVLGHMLEFCGAGSNGMIIQLIIYTFHMPAFFFLMGIVAKPNYRSVARNLYLYILFQILYILFNRIVIGENLPFQFIEPYWILWFSLVSVYYGILGILIEKHKIDYKYAFIVSIICGILAGYVNKIGYVLAISRFFTFLPYFFGGMIFKNSKLKNKKHFIVVVIIIVLVLIPVFYGYYSIHVLFGAYSYADANYNPIIKGSLYIVAFAYILFLYMYMPDKELFIISEIGRNTISVYLLHGFIIRFLRKNNIFVFEPNTNLIISITLSALIVYLLSKIKFSWIKKN